MGINGDFIETDTDFTIMAKGNITREGIMLRIQGHKIQVGSDLRDQDFEILSTEGRIFYNAELGALQLTTTPIFQSSLSFPRMVISVKTSAAGYTLTAAELLGGIVDDTTNTGGIAVVMPTVAAVVAAIPGWQADTSFYFIYRNPGNQTVTLNTDASAQWTMVGTMTIATLNAKLFVCMIDSATAGRVYSIGTFVC